jgi:hypothetical protein
MGERERKWIREKERALSLLLPLLYKNLDIIIVSLSHTYSYEICHLSEDKIPSHQPMLRARKIGLIV